MLIRWLVRPKELSREQQGLLSEAELCGEPLALSAMTLIDIAVSRGLPPRVSARDLLDTFASRTGFQVIPIDLEVAAEIGSIGDQLEVQGDRVIVATARVHRLRLVTSDQRIIDSKLVPVVE